MAEDEAQWEEVGPEHRMTQAMQALLELQGPFCLMHGISAWEFCVVAANVQGLILGGSRDMPTETALGRMEDLRKVMESRLHEVRALGEGTA